MDFNESTQDRINKDPKLLQIYLDENNMKQCLLSEVNIGDRIAFKNQFFLYRSGGYLSEILDGYIVIRGFTNTEFMVNIDNITSIYYRPKVHREPTIITFKLGPVKKLSVSFEGQILKYFRDNASVKRFKETKKYQRILDGEDFRVV